MAGRATYKFSWKSPKNKNMKMLQAGLGSMTFAILSKARLNAPYETGALRNSGRFEQTSEMTWTVTFGDKRVDYAWLREHQNRLHPETTYYLKRAGKEMTARYKTFFKNGR